MGDLERAVRDHCELFNACVAGGDWAPFVATFTDDVRVVLPGLPPIEGRTALEAFYARRPPGDTMHIGAVEPVAGDLVRAGFRWGRGGGGRMLVRWRGEQVAGMEMTLEDQPSVT